MKTLIIFLLALVLSGCAGDKSEPYRHDYPGNGYSNSYPKIEKDPTGNK